MAKVKSNLPKTLFSPQDEDAYVLEDKIAKLKTDVGEAREVSPFEL